MHTQLAQYKKTMAIVMLFVFLFSQIAVAAAPQQQSPYTDPNATPATGGQQPVFTDNSGQAVLGTADNLGNYYLNEFKNSYGWDWLKTTNINFSAFSGNTPQWNIQTFQPLTMKDNLDNFLFAQAQYGSNSNTLNAGLGYRTMNNTRNSLYGVNLFYDGQFTVQGENGYAPSGSLMRVGAGLEYYTGPLEFRANGYYGVGSDVQIGALQTTGPEAGTTAWLHVAPGADLSVGSDFSFWNAPWAKLTATGSYYGQTQNGTINSYKGSALTGNLTASLQLLPQLQISAGVTGGNGSQSSANVGFQLNLLAPPTPALFLADPVINTLANTDISYKMLQPVQRNSTITTERYTKNEITYRTVTIAVSNDQGGLIPNATVSLSIPTATVAPSTLTGTTNALGIAIIRNVPQSATPYNMTVTATGYPVTGSSLTVQSDVTQGQLLNPATAQYTVTFAVSDASGPLPGASVVLGTRDPITTAADGTATFTLTGNGNYTANISKTGYVASTQTVSVAGADVAQPVALIATTNVPFHVQNADDSAAIVGATVTMDGKTATTDNNGDALISNVSVDSLTHAYSITATGFTTVTGTVTVNNTSMPVTNVSMAPVGQTATVNIIVIKDRGIQSDNITPPYVVGATVILDGQTKTTDAYGLATFTNIVRDNIAHAYTITAANYADYSGSVTVNAPVVEQTAAIEANNLTLTVNNIIGSNNSPAFSTYELWGSEGSVKVSSGAITTDTMPLVISGLSNGGYSLKIGTRQGGTATDPGYPVLANIDQPIYITGAENRTVQTVTFPQQTWTIQRINYANGTEIPNGSQIFVGDTGYNYIAGTGIIATNVVNGIARASLTVDGSINYSPEFTINGATTTPVITLPSINTYSATATKIYLGSGTEIANGSGVYLYRLDNGNYWSQVNSGTYSSSNGITFTTNNQGQALIPATYRFEAMVNNSLIPSRPEDYFTLTSTNKSYSGTTTLMNATGTVVVNFTTNAFTYGSEPISLQLYVNNERWYNQAVTTAGTITFNNIPAGSNYSLYAYNSGQRTIYGYSADTTNNISVTDGQTTNVSYTANLAQITVNCYTANHTQVYGSNVTASVDSNDSQNSFVVDTANKQVLIWQRPNSNPRSFYGNIQGATASTQQPITGDAAVNLTAGTGGSGTVRVNVSGNYATAGSTYQVTASQSGSGNSTSTDIVNGIAQFTTLNPGDYYFSVSDKQGRVLGNSYYPAVNSAQAIVNGSNPDITMTGVNVVTLTATLQDTAGNPTTGAVYVDYQGGTPISIDSSGSASAYVWTNTVRYRNLYANFTNGGTAQNSALLDQNRTVVFRKYSQTTSVTVSAINSFYFPTTSISSTSGYVVLEGNGLRLEQYYRGGETSFPAVPAGSYNLFLYNQEMGFNSTNNGNQTVVVESTPVTVAKLLPKVAYTNLQGAFDAQGTELTTGSVTVTLNGAVVATMPVSNIRNAPQYMLPTGATMSATYTPASGGTPQTLYFTSTEHPTKTSPLAVTTSAYTFTNLRLTL